MAHEAEFPPLRSGQASPLSTLLQTPSTSSPLTPEDRVSRLQTDLATLRQIVRGLEELERRLNERRILSVAIPRGYFTPDEEVEVRQLLLAYRNYRIACYNILVTSRDYPGIQPAELRLRVFLVAFATALTLYSRSLRIIQETEHLPMLRKKLNEPEPRMDLPADFFEDILDGYSSLPNYRMLREADAFWRRNRREVRRCGLQETGDGAWLVRVITQQRKAVRRRLIQVLWLRLRRDWRRFWNTTFAPASQARYALQSQVGTLFAGVHLTPSYQPGMTPDRIRQLRAQLLPGDILLTRSESKLTAALLPGFWAHAAIFLGNLQELESIAGPLSPDLAAELRKATGDEVNGAVIESIAPQVRINRLETCLQADHVAVLRPRLEGDQIRRVLLEALAHLGRPYDFEFDFTSSTRVVCTGLVFRSYHGQGSIRLQLTPRLGRYTLSGDDLLHQTLDLGNSASQTAPFQFPVLFLKRRAEVSEPVAAHRIPLLLRRIRQGWRPARRPRQSTPRPVALPRDPALPNRAAENQDRGGGGR